MTHNRSCTVGADLLKDDFWMKGATQERDSSNDFASIPKFLKIILKGIIVSLSLVL